MSVWSPVKKVLYDVGRFKAEYLVSPENFRIVKALTGDKSDNIPGIKGFGNKTVAKMFPELAGAGISNKDFWDRAEALEQSTLKIRLIEEKSRFEENLQLVDLSQPMLSATAARQARDAMSRDLGCRELELKMRMVRDGTTMSDDHLTRPFREFVIRRRKSLEKIVREKADSETAEEGTRSDS